MADPERDPERELRVGSMLRKIQEATEGATIGDAQMAFSNAIALMALSTPDPEVTLLTTLEQVSEVYRGIRAHVRAGNAPQEIVN